MAASQQESTVKSIVREFAIHFTTEYLALSKEHVKNQIESNPDTTEFKQAFLFSVLNPSVEHLLTFSLQFCRAYEYQLVKTVVYEKVPCENLAEFLAHQVFETQLQNPNPYLENHEEIVEVLFKCLLNANRADEVEVEEDKGLICNTTHRFLDFLYEPGIVIFPTPNVNQIGHSECSQFLVKTSSRLPKSHPRNFRLLLDHESYEERLKKGYKLANTSEIDESYRSFVYTLSNPALLAEIETECSDILKKDLKLCSEQSEQAQSKAKQFQNALEMQAQKELRHTDKLAQQITTSSENMGKLDPQLGSHAFHYQEEGDVSSSAQPKLRSCKRFEIKWESDI